MLRRLFFLFLFLALSACSRAPKLPPLPPDSVVLAFGDSVTYGTGAAKGEDWPAQLAGMTGWRFINAGIPGDTAESGKDRLNALMEQHRPALVIVEIGGNDFLRQRSRQAVKEDIRDMLATIRRNGARALLVAVPELSAFGAITRHSSDAPLYAELGKEEKVPVVANVFSEILAKPELCSDPIHPNSRGYRQMAGGIMAELKKSGLMKE